MFGIISQKIQSIKRAYSAKRPVEKWDLVRRAGNIILSIIFCDYLRQDFEVTVLTFIPTVSSINFITVLCYTLFCYRNQLLLAIQSLTVLSILIPVRLLYNFLKTSL